MLKQQKKLFSKYGKLISYQNNLLCRSGSLHRLPYHNFHRLWSEVSWNAAYNTPSCIWMETSYNQQQIPVHVLYHESHCEPTHSEITNDLDYVSINGFHELVIKTLDNFSIINTDNFEIF